MLSETLEEKQAQEKALATVVESHSKIRALYEPMTRYVCALYKSGPTFGKNISRANRT
jgi:hypothetical protein